MAWLYLHPTRFDRAVARRMARQATGPVEQGLKVLTWAADEHVLLGGAGLLWAACRLAGSRRAVARADHIMLATMVSAALPHLIKLAVDRRRPDRELRRQNPAIPRSGKALDSFPSGHAMHLGALANAVSHLTPRRWRPLVWLGAFGLAGTRIGLLAHYLTDVLAGFGLGMVVDRLVDRIRPLDPED